MKLQASFQSFKKLDIPDGTVLDGVIIVTDPAGEPDFEAMMRGFQSKRNILIHGTLTYGVFDIIQYKVNR